MSSEKKDLTRIEDLDEYLHELSDDESSFEPPSEIPFDDKSDDHVFEQTNDFVSEEENVTFNEAESDFSFGEESPSRPSETFDFPATDDTSSSIPENSMEAASEGIPPEEELPGPSLQTTEEHDFLTPLEDSLAEIEPTVAPNNLPEEEKIYKAPESFEDIKRFAESTSFSGMGAEGNPSFSVLLKNVRFLEDVMEITDTLKELGLLSDSEEQTKARLMRGHLLVPRISEYAAIFLAHKLRRFDIDIQVGLSDEIHPPKHQELPETGIVSRHSLYQNQTHHFNFDNPKLDLSQIIVAATSNLEGHQIIRYLGIASEHKMLDGRIVEDEASEEIPHHYAELAQKLKAHALKAHANAIVGLNYQLTPLPSDFGPSSSRYRLSCTGNLVWVNKL